MDEPLLYDLSEPLKIADEKGGFTDTYQIELAPPSMKHFDEVSDFEQLFMGAIVSAGTMVDNGSDKEELDDDALAKLKKKAPTATEIKLLLHISQKIKYKDVFKAFRKLACLCGKVDEGVKLKKKHFEMMSKKDVDMMICTYASVFTFPSLLSGE